MVLHSGWDSTLRPVDLYGHSMTEWPQVNTGEVTPEVRKRILELLPAHPSIGSIVIALAEEGIHVSAYQVLLVIQDYVKE